MEPGPPLRRSGDPHGNHAQLPIDHAHPDCIGSRRNRARLLNDQLHVRVDTPGVIRMRWPLVRFENFKFTVHGFSAASSDFMTQLIHFKVNCFYFGNLTST